MTGNPQLIMEVTDVSTSWLESQPPYLVVNAKGKVSKAGWTDPDLSRVEYVTPPEDGIQEYHFIGTPPSGIVPQVISPIAASDRWHNPPKWLKGVRVKAANNSMEEAAALAAD